MRIIKAIMVVIAREAKTSPVREPGLVLVGSPVLGTGVRGSMMPDSTGTDSGNLGCTNGKNIVTEPESAIENMRDSGSLTSADVKTVTNSDGKFSAMQPGARPVVPCTRRSRPVIWSEDWRSLSAAEPGGHWR